jgi:hypothetical protein
MEEDLSLTRRGFLSQSVAAVGVAAVCSIGSRAATTATNDGLEIVGRIKDPDIRAGVEAAIQKNLVPAAAEVAYPGHFWITADGEPYGRMSTWPGLDSWQMAGAYLLLGRTRLVENYFDFVRASQRKDGNIPFAVFPEMKPNNTCLRGLKWPDDVFTYKPPHGESVPATGWEPRKWIGLFDHWQNVGDPLTTLGAVCYILTAAEIFDSKPPDDLVSQRIPSVQRAAQYLLRRKANNGLINGCGFYSEQPPRKEWDGVTQCYVIHALRELARVIKHMGMKPEADGLLSAAADGLTKSFSREFWRGDHFGEYIHPEHGLVDSHGLSDVNWAAVAFNVATDEQIRALWPKLMAAKEFWWGEMPTQSVTKPFAYEGWEQNFGPPCPVPPLNDVAAMGRVWFLEAMACKRMKAHDRLIESVRKVCRMAKDGYWRERYHPQKDGTVSQDGSQKYCEYPAVLVRVVLGAPEVFCK